MTKVTLYTTSTCPFCLMQKKYFAEKNVQYTNILVDKQPDEAMKMVEISGQMGVPFTVVDREDGTRVTILGFDKTKIDDAIGI